jgi:hypothetical protein
MSTRAVPIVATMSGLLLGACGFHEQPDLDDPPASTEYQLVPRGNLATLGDIGAITSDGVSHWIVAQTADGEYWTPDPTHIYRLDAATGARSEPIDLPDHWERPTGAAWDGGLIWIHYDSNSDGLITTVDPVTGVETPRFSVGSGIGGIDVHDGLLYLGHRDTSAVIEVRDPTNGAIVDEIWCEPCGETLRGLAVTTAPGTATLELWSGTWRSNRLQVMVDRVLRAEAPIHQIGTNDMDQLTFHGESLTALVHNQLYFFDVVRPPP